MAGLMEGKRQSMSGGGMKGLVEKFTVVWRPVCSGLVRCDGAEYTDARSPGCALSLTSSSSTVLHRTVTVAQAGASSSRSAANRPVSARRE